MEIPAGSLMRSSTAQTPGVPLAISQSNCSFPVMFLTPVKILAARAIVDAEGGDEIEIGHKSGHGHHGHKAVGVLGHRQVDVKFIGSRRDLPGGNGPSGNHRTDDGFCRICGSAIRRQAREDAEGIGRAPPKISIKRGCGWDGINCRGFPCAVKLSGVSTWISPSCTASVWPSFVRKEIGLVAVCFGGKYFAHQLVLDQKHIAFLQRRYFRASILKGEECPSLLMPSSGRSTWAASTVFTRAYR